MIVVERATEEDLEDVLVIGAAADVAGRAAYLVNAVRTRQALVARRIEERLGIAVVNDAFFGQHFVWLLCVRPEHRRQGVASALLDYIERTRPTDRLFTSTHESNAPMRALMEKRGYRRSGYVENLGEGGPEIIYVKWLPR